MTPQEKARDKRLRKIYGWSLEMVNALSEIQGHRCAACGREAKSMPLNVDHIHFHITAMRGPRTLGEAGIKEFEGWNATCIEIPIGYFWAKTKVRAMALARQAALPLSVRGLLCAGRYAGCNRKLGRIDDPVWLRRCADYLDNWPSRQVFPPKTV